MKQIELILPYYSGGVGCQGTVAAKVMTVCFFVLRGPEFLILIAVTVTVFLRNSYFRIILLSPFFPARQRVLCADFP